MSSYSSSASKACPSSLAPAEGAEAAEEPEGSADIKDNAGAKVRGESRRGKFDADINLS